MHNQTQIDIETHQKHRYNAILIFTSIFFSRNYSTWSHICFLLNTSNIFRATVKPLQYSLHPAWS